MSRHSRRTRANNRVRHQRAERKAARRKARKAKMAIVGETCPELAMLPKGTKVARG